MRNNHSTAFRAIVILAILFALTACGAGQPSPAAETELQLRAKPGLSSGDTVDWGIYR
jgi:hypothetical protein